MKQEYTSAKTSINSKRVPAVFKKTLKYMPKGGVNLDVGGGKFDTATEFLADNGIVNLIYDPYNRSRKHNYNILKAVNNHNGVNTVTCSSVLNVIQEDEVLFDIAQLCYDSLNGYGVAFFTVYEGDKSGVGRKTNKGYQRNEKLDRYRYILKSIFPKVTKINGVFICSKSDVDAFVFNEEKFIPLNIEKTLDKYMK